jgi:DNA (cytosine-5)-methyltransferase 1
MIALDLFAGSGWGVACQRAGIHDLGVEIMEAAVHTREANGLITLYNDVWDLLGLSMSPIYSLLIGSPPCQTFSTTGNQAGVKALSIIHDAIRDRAYRSKEDLVRLAKATDPRTALVLVPLAFIYRDRPEYVVLEQVPTVLPVWERYAHRIKTAGYSVWTGILGSDKYGVPQTRNRAVLIARRDGHARPPQPTHISARSMVDVLPDIGMVQRSNYSGGQGRGVRKMSEPSFTITSKPPTWIPADAHPLEVTGKRFTMQEMSLLQTYPDSFIWKGSKSEQHLQIGNSVPPLFGQRIIEAAIA